MRSSNDDDYMTTILIDMELKFSVVVAETHPHHTL